MSLNELYREVTNLAEGVWTNDVIPIPHIWAKVSGSNWYQVGPDDLTAGSGSLLSLEVNRSFPSYVYSGSASGRVWRTRRSRVRSEGWVPSRIARWIFGERRARGSRVRICGGW